MSPPLDERPPRQLEPGQEPVSQGRKKKRIRLRRRKKKEERNGSEEAVEGEEERRGGGVSRSCCFCWCCCCSCSCLSVKNHPKEEVHQSPMTSTAGGAEPHSPTSDEIRAWGESFDRLMKCSAGRRVFREFLRCEYSEENILFWSACEELKAERDPRLVEEKARLIYEDYVSILSPREVSLDSQVREIVNRNMTRPTAHAFDEAQLQIYTLMRRDSYPRFLASPLYRRMARP